MRKFIEEHGLAITTAIVVMLLITLATPIGEGIRDNISETLSRFRSGASERYVITLYAGDGRFEDQKTFKKIIVDKNTGIGPLPETAKDNYIFNGWWTASSGGEEVSESDIFDKDTSLYAHYRASGTISENDSTNGMHNGHLFVNGVDEGELKVGSVFNWHNYDWRVIYLENNTALIISEYVLDAEYNANTFGEGVIFNNISNTQEINGRTVANCYKNSSLDAYMEYFYTTYLNSDNAIIDSAISIGTSEDENAYTSSITTRHIFALSAAESRQFLPYESWRAGVNNYSYLSYWTRSGVEKKEALIVFSDETFKNGNIESKNGARPAMYVDLTKINGVN